MFNLTTSTKKGRKERKAKWLAYMLVECDEQLSAKKVKERYRKRFGIEASYRCAKKVRGWTTSPNAAYRFVLLGMSFWLTNNLAGTTNRMDEESPSWWKSLEAK